MSDCSRCLKGIVIMESQKNSFLREGDPTTVTPTPRKFTKTITKILYFIKVFSPNLIKFKKIILLSLFCIFVGKEEINDA